jgi:hypothetical protein
MTYQMFFKDLPVVYKPYMYCIIAHTIVCWNEIQGPGYANLIKQSLIHFIQIKFIDWQMKTKPRLFFSL